MMNQESWISADIEMVVSSLWKAVYATQCELMTALLFVIAWRLGVFFRKTHQKKKQPTLYKVGKPTHPNHMKGQANQAGCGKRPSNASETTKPVVAPFDGHIEHVTPELLKDCSWVVPQVAQLCRAQLTQALELYRAAMQAGLQLQDMPAESRHILFLQMVTAAVRAGQTDEVRKLFGDLMTSGLGVDSSLFTSTVKLCTSKQLYAESLAIFDFVSKDPSFAMTDRTVWSCLLFCAIEMKAQHKCEFFFERVKDYGTPQPKDFGNMLRLAGLKRDWQTSLTLLQDMAKSTVEINSVQCNTALATCVGAGRISEARTLLDTIETLGGVADVISYNTLMKGYAQGGRIEECFELFDRLQAVGVSPSQVTYGILIDVCINENQVDRAVQIFADMNKNGCPLNTVLYTLLIKGFARAGDCDQAMNVYSQMQTERTISPDIITFSILIKANCDSDRLEEALILLGDMVASGLKPDEVVFNTLIAGCAKQGNVNLGKQLFTDMIASGVRPSNATFSILIRVYHACKCLEEAVTMLNTMFAKHNVEPEPRLYLQLMQACIRERQGRRTIEVYGMLSERSMPTQATHSSVLSTCMNLHMYDTATEIIRIAVANGASVLAKDTNAVLEGAFKKNKTQLVRICVASMQTMGHNVDPKFVV